MQNKDIRSNDDDDDEDNKNDDNHKDKHATIKSHTKSIYAAILKKEKNKAVSRRQFSCFRKSREHSCNAAVHVPD